MASPTARRARTGPAPASRVPRGGEQSTGVGTSAQAGPSLGRPFPNSYVQIRPTCEARLKGYLVTLPTPLSGEWFLFRRPIQ